MSKRTKRSTFRDQGIEVVGAPGMTDEEIKIKNNLGYVHGYGEYMSKSAVHFGPSIQQKKKINKLDGDEYKYASLNVFGMYDNQSDIFKMISDKSFQQIAWGYENKRKKEHEDPTYLIFDIKIDYNNSTLFAGRTQTTNNLLKIIEDDNYKKIPEFEKDNRLIIFGKFKNIIQKIFPGDLKEEFKFYSYKEHYIESVSGLNVLNKKIINYPEDHITFTLSEDIEMSIQYLTELYNNLIYSYDTHRILIPENLLRFNMMLVISDFRNMKKDINTINKEISKMIYILHDCQFDFFESKNFGEEIKRGGFNASKPSEPAKSTIKVNFKSISKIMVPSLINNSMIVDLRERKKLDFDGYEEIFDDTKPASIIPIGERDNTQQSRMMRYLRNEAAQIRNVIINKLKNEVTNLTDQAQNWMNKDKFGVTITKVNVYHDTIGDKLSMADKFVKDFIDKKVSEWKKEEENTIRGKDSKADRDRWREEQNNQSNTRTRDNKLSYPEPQHDIGYDLDGVPTYNDPERDPIYGDTSFNIGDKIERELPTDQSIKPEPQHDIGYDLDGVPTYNNKQPNGDVHEDGQYNEKYPEGDVHEDSQYNEKYPEGDVHEDGTYHNKPPLDSDGNIIDVHPDPTYNRKYPDGNVYDKNNE